MTGIWTTIKAAATPALSQQQQQHERNDDTIWQRATDNSRTSPRTLGTPALDARDPRSQASTTPQAHARSPGPSKSPSRPPRRTSSIALKDRDRDKDKASRSGSRGNNTETQATEDVDEDRNGTGTGQNIPSIVIANGTGTPTVAASSSSNGPDVTLLSATPAAAHTPSANSAIDPLSQHIFMRKNTEPSIPQRLTQMAEGLARASTELSRNAVPAGGGGGGGGELSREKSSRKGSSFLSRLSMRPGRKKDLGLDLDSDSELGSDARMDGLNARVFSHHPTLGSPLVGGGYVPHHKEPPRYIRTKASNKRTREFNRMFLAQELVGTRLPEKDDAADPAKVPAVSVSVADRKTVRTGGAIWATEFSKDGKYLASAGRDHVVRVWGVISTPEERRAHEDEETSGERLSAPVFRDQPVKEFRGHTGEVLDLSWSKNNFLLSSSMDKTVRLWHMSREECLCTFKHKDFVTRLAFHPRDDRFFLAGSLDTMVRLWSIPDQAVAFSAQLPDLVTAVAFSPDGKVAIAGLLNGMCMFYETEGLKLISQVHVRVLITSNDSRIRIYSLANKTLLAKLKGHENLCSQIAASFSDDGRHVICGSEDRRAFVWSLTPLPTTTTITTAPMTLLPENAKDRDLPPSESFDAHPAIVTTALFAPTATRVLLGASGDPIYDLCNPPPVVLQSLEEAAAASQIGGGVNDHVAAATPTTEAPLPVIKRPEPSPAYLARATHYDGHILVTTGDEGVIKVFRQDCTASEARKMQYGGVVPSPAGDYDDDDYFGTNSSGTGQSQGSGNKAHSSSRPSASKAKSQESEVEAEETDADTSADKKKEKDKEGRRKSVAVLPAKGGSGAKGKSDRRKSLPPERLLQGHGDGA
ncbi:hypothetical protein N0V88_007657 [Collariella sp. IMI 366227]|nr:hypothetical protein N0V88_007657 [Collariella sp. IMI 366227]